MENFLTYKYIYELQYSYVNQNFQIVRKLIPVYENKDFVFCKINGSSDLMKISQKHIINSIDNMIEALKKIGTNYYFSWSVSTFFIGINKKYNSDLYNKLEKFSEKEISSIDEFFKIFMENNEYQAFMKKEKLNNLEKELSENKSKIEKYYNEIEKLKNRNLFVESNINDIKKDLFL